MPNKRKLVSEINKKILEHIGLISVDFSLSEELLSYGIKLLLFDNNRTKQQLGEIVSAKLSFGRKIEAFNALFRHRFPNRNYSDLEHIFKGLIQIEEKRNVIIHSLWLSNNKGGETKRMKRVISKGLKFHFEDISVNELSIISNLIEEVNFELITFIIKYLKVAYILKNGSIVDKPPTASK